MTTNDDKNTITAELKGPWPQLTEDQKAELRTAAPQLVAASRGASEHAHGLVRIQPAGIWQAVAVSAAHSLAAMAGGLALLGATAAWLACGDGEEKAPPSDHSEADTLAAVVE